MIVCIWYDAFNEIKEVLRISRETLIKDIDYQMNIAKKAIKEIDRELENEMMILKEKG